MFRPLRDNEMFEIRLDRLVDKWSGSIEVGVTTHNPGGGLTNNIDIIEELKKKNNLQTLKLP